MQPGGHKSGTFHYLALGLILGLALGLAIGHYWLCASRALPLDLPTPAPPPPTPTPLPIHVDISGAVVHPGMYTLPAGSRLHALIQAAGGLTDAADRRQVNLALLLHDGQHIHIPVRSQGKGASTPHGKGTVVFPLDINKASAQELEAIPGVGPAMAKRIIQGRPYGRVEDLLRVKGIGPATLEKLRPYVTVEP